MSDKQILKKLGKRIADIRTEKGLTQAVVADQCDIERSNLARIEAGNTNVTFLTLIKLSNALQTPMKVLIDIDQQ